MFPFDLRERGEWDREPEISQSDPFYEKRDHGLKPLQP